MCIYIFTFPHCKIFQISLNYVEDSFVILDWPKKNCCMNWNRWSYESVMFFLFHLIYNMKTSINIRQNHHSTSLSLPIQMLYSIDKNVYEIDYSVRIPPKTFKVFLLLISFRLTCSSDCLVFQMILFFILCLRGKENECLNIGRIFDFVTSYATLFPNLF